MHANKTNWQKVQELLDENQIDGLFLMSKQNRYWMTGFLNSSGYYLASRTRSVLLMDKRYEIAKEPGQTRDCEVMIINNAKDIFTNIYEYVKEMGIKRLGIESEYLTHKFIKIIQDTMVDVEVVPVSVSGLRMSKTPLEIEYTAKAGEISDLAWIEVCKNFKLGKTENDLENELFQWFVKLGADKEFPRVIITSGERSILPHGKPSDKVIQVGELLTIDGGAVYQGYRADMTRTVAIGEVSQDLKDIYQAVKDAQQAGIDLVKPGIKASDVHQAVFDSIEKTKFKGLFYHQTGHGIGIEVHEPPRIGYFDETILEPGMTFTIEPGIYIPSVGGVRIEDVVLVTQTGHELLNKLDRNLVNILKDELKFEEQVDVKVNQ